MKYEGLNPTGSFKDRGMTVAVSISAAEGAQAVVCASTGNTSASAAAYASRAGMLPIVLMFVVLYFVMIRPQMKRQKEHKAMIDAIAKGDEVVIGGGVLGKVTKTGDNYLYVEIAIGVEVQVQRAAVVQVLPKGTVK